MRLPILVVGIFIFASPLSQVSHLEFVLCVIANRYFYFQNQLCIDVIIAAVTLFPEEIILLTVKLIFEKVIYSIECDLRLVY